MRLGVEPFGFERERGMGMVISGVAKKEPFTHAFTAGVRGAHIHRE